MTIAIVAILCFLSASAGACFGFIICGACMVAKDADAEEESSLEDADNAIIG